MIKFYGYKRCGTCRKAEKHLEAKKKKFDFIDITEKPPKLAELKKIIAMSGKELSAFYNTSGEQYKALNIKEKRQKLSEAEQVKLLAGNGRLLKRPIITDGKKASVGFRDDAEAMWK